MQKTAIVTGASRGFGRGIASVLSMEGEYKVFATARNKAALDSLKKEVDEFKGAGEVIPYVLDQNNDKEVEKFSEEITDGNNKQRIPRFNRYDTSFWEALLGKTYICI